MRPTADPYVVVEMEAPGYVQYRNRDGRRWAIHGTCNGKGMCMEGEPAGANPVDYPKTPESKKCCALQFIELPPCKAGTF